MPTRPSALQTSVDRRNGPLCASESGSTTQPMQLDQLRQFRVADRAPNACRLSNGRSSCTGHEGEAQVARCPNTLQESQPQGGPTRLRDGLFDCEHPCPAQDQTGVHRQVRATGNTGAVPRRGSVVGSLSRRHCMRSKENPCSVVQLAWSDRFHQGESRLVLWAQRCPDRCRTCPLAPDPRVAAPRHKSSDRVPAGPRPRTRNQTQFGGRGCLRCKWSQSIPGQQ